MTVLRKCRYLVTLFILASCPTIGSPADDAKINIFVTTTSQDSPLQVIGFKLPDKVGSTPVLLVFNASDKEVREFSIEAAVGNPAESARLETGEEVAVGIGNSSLHSGWPAEGSIPPNGHKEAHREIFRSHNLALWGQRLHSNCLHVAAIVTKVKFADGTTWELESPKAQTTWKSSLDADSTKSCKHSPEVENALKQWSGASGYVSTGSPSHADTGIVKSYSITCPLQMVGGTLTAVCPW
jgi:hypothetical protein